MRPIAVATTAALLLSLAACTQRSDTVAHDLATAPADAFMAAIAAHCGQAYAGKVVEDSAVADFFRAPKHPYSAALLAATPKYTDPLAGLQPVPEAVIAAVRAEVGHG